MDLFITIWIFYGNRITINNIIFFRYKHKFHFGGNGKYWSHWNLSIGINKNYQRTQIFLLSGEIPLSLSRSIIAALGIVKGF